MKATLNDLLNAKGVSEPLREAVKALINRLEEAEKSAGWHKRRWMALQMHQARMRDPERTMVCDILANGELMHPIVDGDRYAVKET